MVKYFVEGPLVWVSDVMVMIKVGWLIWGRVLHSLKCPHGVTPAGHGAS